MEMIKLLGMNRELHAPKDWDAEKDGECGTLPVFAEVVNGGMTMTSAWKPSKEEINELVKGGAVAMVIHGTMHPPIALGVFPAEVVVGAVALTGEGGDVPVVDEAMVEAGCEAMAVAGEFEDNWPSDYTDEQQTSIRRIVRAVITAALGKGAQIEPSPVAAEEPDVCDRCGSAWEDEPVCTSGGNMDRCSNADCQNMRWYKVTVEARPTCQLCGEPMPPGEEMFMYHGHSGPCPEKAT